MTKRKDTKFQAKLSNIADRRLHHVSIVSKAYTWSWQGDTMLSPAEAEQLRLYCLKLELQGRILHTWIVDEPCADYGFEQLSESLMAALPLIPAQGPSQDQGPSMSPSSDKINALPDWARAYIHDLEARADPAGDVRTIAELKDNQAALLVTYGNCQAALESARRGVAHEGCPYCRAVVSKLTK